MSSEKKSELEQEIEFVKAHYEKTINEGLYLANAWSDREEKRSYLYYDILETGASHAEIAAEKLLPYELYADAEPIEELDIDKAHLFACRYLARSLVREVSLKQHALLHFLHHLVKKNDIDTFKMVLEPIRVDKTKRYIDGKYQNFADITALCQIPYYGKTLLEQIDFFERFTMREVLAEYGVEVNENTKYYKE